jgi:predicted ATPase
MADLTRYLRERRVIAEEQGQWALARSLPDIERDLPESVRAMIERKIAQLGEEDRKLLVAASVQGYEFDSAVVAQSLGLDAGEVEERLENLERVYTFVRLVEEREFPDHTLTLRYRFVHVLYQNALHAGLRPTRRAQLATSVARAMETYWGEKSAHVANELAALWESARDFARAADYFRVAANNASQVFATREAVELARRGLAMSLMLPENRERIERELSLQLILGNGLIATSGYASTGVEQAYARAHDLCQQHGEIPHSLPVLYGLYAVHLVRGNLRRALELGEEFMKLAERQDDPAVMVAHNLLGYPPFYMGEIARARERFEQSLACYDPARHRPLTWLYGAEPGMAARTYVALAWWILGYPDRALTESREALRWAKETPHAHSHAFAMYYAAAIHLYRREPERLLEIIEPAIALASEQGLALWAASGTSLRGWARVQMGESDDAIEELRRGLNNLQATGSSLGVFEHHCLLAEAYGKIGRVSEGLAALAKAQTLCDEGEERLWEAEMHRLRGELLPREGASVEEAESCFHQAISVAQLQQAKSFELRAVMGLCRLWREQDKRDEARARLAEIYDWFTEGFDTTDLKEARALLDELA